MRWPLMFVSTHDALLGAKDDRLVTVLAENVRAWEMYHRMAEEHRTFVALIAERTAPKAPPQPLAVTTPNPVSRAIGMRAGTNLELRNHLVNFAAERSNAGDAPLTIVRRIQDWGQVADAEPETARDKAEAEAAILDLLG